MAKFYFNPLNNLIIVNNVTYKGNSFFVEEYNENLIINIIGENTLSNVYCQPLFAVLSVKNNIVNVYGPIKLIKWNNDNYDVVYDLPKFNYYTPPKALAQEYYTLRGEQHTVTVYNDNQLHLLCECNSKTSIFDINYNLTDIKILLQPTSIGFLIIIFAKTDDNNEYLNLVLYDGKYNQIFENIANEITFKENSFNFINNINDMLGRVSHKTYTFKDGAFVEAENSFTYKHDKTYPDKLIPYLFLEALQSNDTERAKTYLSDDLIDMLPHFAEYFGDFSSIICPKYIKSYNKKDLLTVALLDNLSGTVNLPRFYTFQCENGKITNVTN